MKFKDYITEQSDPMAGEKLTKLYIELEKAVIKKVEKLPLTAPIADQMLKSMNVVQARLKGKLTLTGRAAVAEFILACHGHFTGSFPPLSRLMRKYKMKMDYDGRVIMEAE